MLLPKTYHSIDMVKGDENGKSAMATKWSSADDATLIETLRNEKAKGSWGDNGPKPVVYIEVVKALIGSESVSGGGPKTVPTVKNRWQKVCVSLQTCYTNELMAWQLKSDYKIVKEL